MPAGCDRTPDNLNLVAAVHLVSENDSPVITSKRDLREFFLSACKGPEKWRLGTEHENIGVYASGERAGRAPAYGGEDGVRAVLESFTERGWKPVHEGEHIIALVRGDAQVTIEPGGQLELAARPVNHADAMKADLWNYVSELSEPSRDLGLAWLGVGFRPFGLIDDVSWMPKQRYEVMREYMPTRGKLAHEMMKRTATVQVNLDYGDVDDAHDKLRSMMSVSSLITAIFACSPIVDGKDSGYQTYRSRVWHDTDPDRCGLLDFVFDDLGSGDIFDRYIEWALDVPLFFVYRDGYQRAGGITFRQFMKDGFRDKPATIEDWALHLSTLFPEARMKKFIEVRGCDSGSMEMVVALAPLCRGLFYDADARRAATALTGSLDMAQRQELWMAVARDGLRAAVPGNKPGKVLDLARDLVAIADDGLRRLMPDELPYLEPIRAIVESGRTQADELLDLWSAANGDPTLIIPQIAHRCLGSDDPCLDDGSAQA